MSANRPFDPIAIPLQANAPVPPVETVSPQPPRDLLASLIVCAPVVVTTLFAKITIPPAAHLGLGFGLPLIVAVLLLGIVTGRVSLDVGRAAYLAFMLSFIVAVQIAREEPFSMSSLALMTVVSLTYIVTVPRAGKGIDEAMQFFVRFALVIAVCGIAQFFLQFAIGAQVAYPIDYLFPRAFVLSGYNNLNPLYYGSHVFKSNGVFLAEPSFFSQLIDIAIVVELATTKRVWRILVFALATIVSYSGTGLLILSVCIPILIVANRRFDVLGILIGVIIIGIVFAVPLKLDLILSRIGEFNEPRSSAFQRFVSWAYLVQDTTFSTPWRALFGYGAGSFREIALGGPFIVAEMFHAKLLVEYGLVGTFVYFGFLVYCTFTSPAPLVVRIAVIVLFFMNGAYADPATGIALTLLFLTPRPPRIRSRRVPPVRRPVLKMATSTWPASNRSGGLG